MVVMARLLMPVEFGLVGMVTAVTGVLGLFKDAGLTLFTVQRSAISDEQVSTLFWINITVGVILGGLSIAVAPFLVSFYREPRLFWITLALGTGFIFNAAGAQHQALLQRHMRYVAISLVEILSLLVSIAVGISMAVYGLGYWALVGMAVSAPATAAIFVWLVTDWVPGWPQRKVGIRSMLDFGSTVTLNGLVTYLTYNADKILLGRLMGAETLGVYGRAYQLINLPTEQLNSAIGLVAYPALSRLQDDPKRFRSYFLKGYSMVLALTIPIIITCALFAENIIIVLLGPRWKDAANIFRLLAPTVLAFALINPFGWFLYSSGRARRSLNISLVLAPVVIVGYITGLRYGAEGVALGFSAAMTLMIGPTIAWAKHGTPISFRDIYQAVIPAFLSGVVAAVLTFLFQYYLMHDKSPFTRLISGCSVLFTVYIVILFYVMKQKQTYVDLIKQLRNSSSIDK